MQIVRTCQNKQKQDLSSLLKDSQTNRLRQLRLGTSDTQCSTCQVQKQYWTNGVVLVVCNLSKRHSSVTGLCKTLDGYVS